MKGFTKNLVVISFDCLASFDYEVIRKLPNFKKVFDNGSIARHVETVYPSLTYPCHCTIVTGKYPKNHGVINNTLLQPGNPSPDWHWYRKSIKGTTLYDEGKKANLTTAALLWPVTGKAKGIRYNMPEIFPNRPWQNQVYVSLRSGSPFYQLELNNRFGHIRNGLNQPELDDFVLESAVYTIANKDVNILLVHFTDLDTMRHAHGVFSKEANEALHRHDKRLGRILDALEAKGKMEEATIIILGDHAALDENKAIHLNYLFCERGLISKNNRGKITNWQAYCKTCDGSAYIYLNQKNDKEAKEKVRGILEELAQNDENGIEKIYTGKEAEEMGADPHCAFMLEASLGYYFVEDMNGPYLHEIEKEERMHHKKYTLAAHGYSPKKENYTAFFAASGKGIKRNVVLDRIRLIDIGPTLAALLGLHLGETDGRTIDELIDRTDG